VEVTPRQARRVTPPPLKQWKQWKSDLGAGRQPHFGVRSRSEERTQLPLSAGRKAGGYHEIFEGSSLRMPHSKFAFAYAQNHARHYVRQRTADSTASSSLILSKPRRDSFHNAWHLVSGILFHLQLATQARQSEQQFSNIQTQYQRG
jgi:hypothetical protein